MVLTRMALARTALTKMRSAANPRTGRRAAAVTRCAAPAVKQPQGFHRATAVPSAAGGSVTVRRISLTTEDRGGELEARRERHLALIIADWRQRKDGAEPSAEELKQMSGMLDDLSEMHRVQNAGAPPDDTHVQQWFGISTTSVNITAQSRATEDTTELDGGSTSSAPAPAATPQPTSAILQNLAALPTRADRKVVAAASTRPALRAAREAPTLRAGAGELAPSVSKKTPPSKRVGPAPYWEVESGAPDLHHSLLRMRLVDDDHFGIAHKSAAAGFGQHAGQVGGARTDGGVLDQKYLAAKPLVHGCQALCVGPTAPKPRRVGGEIVDDLPRWGILEFCALSGAPPDGLPSGAPPAARLEWTSCDPEIELQTGWREEVQDVARHRDDVDDDDDEQQVAVSAILTLWDCISGRITLRENSQFGMTSRKVQVPLPAGTTKTSIGLHATALVPAAALDGSGEHQMDCAFAVRVIDPRRDLDRFAGWKSSPFQRRAVCSEHVMGGGDGQRLLNYAEFTVVKEAGPIKIGLVPAATEEEETASHGVDDDDEESRRERHLALIIADWRQRKDGAEPSAEELKQMSGMLDDLSEMHRVQNAGAPPDDTHVQQWFGISTTSKEVSMPAVGEHFWSSSGQHCSFDGDWGAAWEAHDQSKLPVKLKAINNKQRSERIGPDDDEWMAYQPSYSEGDKLGLALDLEGGTLTAFKNGIRLGVVVPNEKVESLGEGPFCWAVDLEGPGSAVRISDGLPTNVKYNQLRHDHTGAETSSILVF